MAAIDYVKIRNEDCSEIHKAHSAIGISRPSANNVHHDRLVVDGHVSIPSLMATVGDDASICHVVAEMFQLSREEAAKLKVKSVVGGNTNKLYHVSGIPSSSSFPESVLLRIFGGHGMIDREIETSTYAALAKQGIALPYYGRFGNGRLEGWCPNGHHLQVRELSQPHFSLEIARATARLHSKFVIPPELQQHHNPQASPTLWTQLESWLDQALASTFMNEYDTKRAAKLPLAQLKQELVWLKQHVCNGTTTAKVAFCHNDLLAANILRYGDDGNGNEKIQLIDFEYGGMNYAAYDIANHFNEFAGGTNAEDNATPDYSLFPSLQLQLDFCRAYLQECGEKFDDDAVQQLLVQIKGFVLANHLVWGLWAINQAATEGCQGFDYLHYGSCRINRYFFEKQEWESTR
jgi:ethanolamine kinase